MFSYDKTFTSIILLLHVCKVLSFLSSVDATHGDGDARMVNDKKKGDCRMRTIYDQGKPHLCLFAGKDLPANFELNYNYGLDDLHLPWRGKVSISYSL